MKNWHVADCLHGFSSAIVLSGKECSGKTKALQTVISALNGSSSASGGTPIKLQRLYPGALPAVTDLFGYYEPHSGSWTDGIFTSAFRRALKVRVYQEYNAIVAL